MAGLPTLSIAIGDAGPARALKSGRVALEGFALERIDVEPIIGAYRRMVRDLEFDICEMAPTTYVIARAHGAPFTALPIVLMRRFHHNGLVKHPLGGIERPEDLRGKRVGVRAYSVTTGVWTRGILQDEFSVDPASITWVVDDEEHVPGLRLPDNVVQAPPGRSLARMMADGLLDAAFTANAGIGRAGAPIGGWASVPAGNYEEALPHSPEIVRDWFERTSVYPMHSLVVVKDAVLRTFPGLAGALRDAFERSKSHYYLDRLFGTEEHDSTDRRYRADMSIVGDDPLPFGLEANRPAIDMLVRFIADQGMIPSRPAAEELFMDV